MAKAGDKVERNSRKNCPPKKTGCRYETGDDGYMEVL
jgi:hypothetical protein